MTTPLRQKMIEDMQLRGFAVRTQEAYLSAVNLLARHYQKSPDQINEEELRQYFLFLKNEKYAARNTCTIALCGIKFFFQHTLGREWKFFEFVRPPKEKKLPVVLGRDWMSIQLDSGDDLMVFVFHEGGGQLVTLFRADGTVTTILDFTLTATGQWSSPSTGAIYPSGWRLVIPEIQADLIVTPVLVDQEVINADYPEGTYWEGSSVVTGTFAGRPASGAAYVELSGYVHP